MMDYENKISKRAASLQPSAIRRFFDLMENMTDAISLGIGEPDYVTPWHIREAGIYSLEKGFTKYTPNAGLTKLRQAIARYQKRRLGLEYDPKGEIFVTVGGSEGIDLALRALVNPGDEVIVPTPAFLLYEDITGMCRGKFVPLNTSDDGFQIDPEKLNALINEHTKAIVLNTPNNPTGTILNEDSLKAVHDAVKGKEIFVICDDVYRQIVYTGNYHSFTEFHDLREQIILVQSFSKPYAMTGWRMGYLCADASVIDRMQLAHSVTITSTPAMFQDAAIKALETDPSGMLKQYQRRRDLMVRRISEIGLDMTEPEGAFYVFPRTDRFGMTSAEFCTRLINEAGVGGTPGQCFGDDRFIRFSYAASDHMLAEAMNRLERFIRSL